MNFAHAEVATLDPTTMRTLCEEYIANNYIDPETSERLGVKRGLRNPDGTGGGENSVLYGAGVVPAISRFTTVYKRMETGIGVTGFFISQRNRTIRTNNKTDIFIFTAIGSCGKPVGNTVGQRARINGKGGKTHRTEHTAQSNTVGIRKTFVAAVLPYLSVAGGTNNIVREFLPIL